MTALRQVAAHKPVAAALAQSGSCFLSLLLALPLAAAACRCCCSALLLLLLCLLLPPAALAGAHRWLRCATFVVGEARQRQQYVGRLQEVLEARIGNRPVTLLRVLWYRQRVWDERLRLHKVRVSGATDNILYEPDQLIEARRIDCQIWLSTIEGTPHWRHVHYKMKAAHVTPEHLLEPAE